MSSPVLAVIGNYLVYSTDGNAITRALPDGADISAAIMQMIDEASPSPRTLDFVYHPHELQCVVAECANVTRAKHHKIFAGEHRELTNPAVCWGLTKPQPHVDGKFTTVLHFEERPRLEHLARLLEENQSTQVRVAVPPAALLVHRHKSDGIELAILIAGDNYLYFHVNEHGKPAVRVTRNFDVTAELLSVAISSRAKPPAQALVVCDADTPPGHIADFLASHGIQPLVERWPTFLSTEIYRPADMANLAQRPFKWRQHHTLWAVTAAFAFGAIALIYTYARDSYTAHQAEQNIVEQRAVATTELAELQAAQVAHNEASAIVGDVPLANPRPSVFLEAVTQALPPALQLQGFSYRDGNFTIEGIAYEGVGQERGPLSQFIDSLVAGGNSRPWEFKSPKSVLNSSSWTLTGSLKP